MPTYLCHGFRWPRPLIRIHIILQNLDDATAEWVMAPATTNALLANFNHLYPQLLAALPGLKFIEQYDPEDTTTKSQPYAYVCDIVKEIKLSVDIDNVRGKGLSNEQWSAVLELRDKLAPGEKVGWWIVVCGDVERWAPPTMELLEGGAPTGVANGSSSMIGGNGSKSRGRSRSGSSPVAENGGYPRRSSSPRGIKKWFSRRGAQKSSGSSLKNPSPELRPTFHGSSTPPPLPIPPQASSTLRGPVPGTAV